MKNTQIINKNPRINTIKSKFHELLSVKNQKKPNKKKDSQSMSSEFFLNLYHPVIAHGSYTSREQAIQSIENLRQYAISLCDYAETDDCILEMKAETRLSAERIFLKANEIEEKLSDFA